VLPEEAPPPDEAAPDGAPAPDEVLAAPVLALPELEPLEPARVTPLHAPSTKASVRGAGSQHAGSRRGRWESRQAAKPPTDEVLSGEHDPAAARPKVPPA